MPRTRRRVREPNGRQEPEMSDAELQRIADKELLGQNEHWRWLPTTPRKRREMEAQQGPGWNARRAAARERQRTGTVLPPGSGARPSLATLARRKAKKVNKNLRTSDEY